MIDIVTYKLADLIAMFLNGILWGALLGAWLWSRLF